MSAQPPRHDEAWAGRTIVLTRPAGTASSLARQVRARGGVPLRLPGLSLRAAPDVDAARAAWRGAQHDDVLVFTSPAAVRYAAALAPLATQAVIVAVGQGTARALRRLGAQVHAPSARQDSESTLALASLQALQGRRVALITAPGGRGLLREQLAARGATLREVYVYRRVAPRWNRRHIEAISRLPEDACVLLSSGEALQHVLALLPAGARQRLCASIAIVSSERLADIAREAGFSRVCVAASARSVDLLAGVDRACSRTSREGDRAGC